MIWNDYVRVRACTHLYIRSKLHSFTVVILPKPPGTDWVSARVFATAWRCQVDRNSDDFGDVLTSFAFALVKFSLTQTHVWAHLMPGRWGQTITRNWKCLCTPLRVVKPSKFNLASKTQRGKINEHICSWLKYNHCSRNAKSSKFIRVFCEPWIKFVLRWQLATRCKKTTREKEKWDERNMVFV